MRSSLADILILALPHASRSLIPIDARGRLERLSASLPPIPCILLECRLNGSPRVDLSIGVSSREKQLLLGFFGGERVSSGWTSFSRFVDWWCGGEEHGPDSMWLEFDAGEPDQPFAPPSVFLPMTEADHRGDASPGLRKGLDLLRPGASELLTRWLRRLPEGAKATFAGVMLARNDPGLRLNMAGLTPADAYRWLRSFGSARPELEESFAEVFRLGGDPVLTVDVGAEVGSRFGLECQPAPERSPELLAILERCKVCSGEIGRAAWAWQGQSNPLTEGAANWPLVLVLEALTQPETHLSFVVRFVNHVKIVFDAAGLVEAKVYLALNHLLLPTRRMRTGVP